MRRRRNGRFSLRGIKGWESASHAGDNEGDEHLYLPASFSFSLSSLISSQGR